MFCSITPENLMHQVQKWSAVRFWSLEFFSRFGKWPRKTINLFVSFVRPSPSWTIVELNYNERYLQPLVKLEDRSDQQSFYDNSFSALVQFYTTLAEVYSLQKLIYDFKYCNKPAKFRSLLSFGQLEVPKGPYFA